MASHITVAGSIAEEFSQPTLRENLDALGEENLSQTSPVTAGASEVAIAVDHDAEIVSLRVEGHEGEFTRTTERQLKRTLRDTEGVSDVSVANGGYDG